MSFVTAQSPALMAAATRLQGLGSSMAAQNAAAAAPTTEVAPAAADEVSALQAMQFSAYGTWYQQISAQASAIHPNGILDTVAWQMFALIPAAVLYAYYLGGGSAGAAAVAGDDLGAGLGGGVLAGAAAPAALAAPAGALGGAPVLASMASASPVGGLSVPSGWSAATPDTGAATLAGSGWTAPPEESMPMTNVAAGMPAVASSGRGGYGFSAPRYGVKPTVMPKSVFV